MAFKIFQNHPILAFILALLFTHEILYTAFAASGGRMGGTSFSSEEETSSYSSSNSYDVYHYHYGKPGYSRGYESYDGNSRRVSAEPKRENDMNKSGKGFFSWFALLPLGIFGGFLLWMVCTYDTAASVVKIQVGLSGKAHSLQRDLNNLAGAGDTSEKKGFHIILTESIVALLRHQNYWISGYSSVKQKRGVEAVEKEFRQLSAEEREKFEIESLVNVDNIKVQRTFIPKDNKLRNDFIVVTLVVAVRGAPNLPAIRSTEDLRKALHHLNSITSRETLAVEVLWTPQVEHDTLSEDELLEKYPILRPI
ncbi:FLUCTUATING-LIGHT-ACCLIMATION protein 1, chloroplastic [Quercus suber]|uniref:Uncharacterized protein n=1 Tax=Quercus suber TaxID=58331 RepID=A0AAW0LWH2_QUESU|nr:uncharacterized protein LOC112028567 [Quercus suber]POF04914.1 hypothetical protein CFP56_76001 [Quercus suber]